MVEVVSGNKASPKDQGRKSLHMLDRVVTQADHFRLASFVTQHSRASLPTSATAHLKSTRYAFPLPFVSHHQLADLVFLSLFLLYIWLSRNLQF